MADPLLALAGVHTHVGPYHILQGVDFAVPRGGLTALLGRNGAGKTTTLRTIMGLWHASAGSVRFNGNEIAAWATPDVAQAGIAYVPENMGIFADLTVRENLLLAARAGDIGYSICSRRCRSSGRRRPGCSPAARSRCWRSRARSSSRASSS